jgi:hypothetical protein
MNSESRVSFSTIIEVVSGIQRMYGIEQGDSGTFPYAIRTTPRSPAYPVWNCTGHHEQKARRKPEHVPRSSLRSACSDSIAPEGETSSTNSAATSPFTASMLRITASVPFGPVG